MRAEVLGGLGGFSGAFFSGEDQRDGRACLLSGTDGCGTKVKLAILMDKHDTIGIDAVANVCQRYRMCRWRTIVLPGLHCMWQELIRRRSQRS